MNLTHKGSKLLETERLILRPFQKGDEEMMFRNWTNDDEVTKFLRWETHQTIEDSRKILELWIEESADPKNYHWGIQLKNGELIGAIGMFGLNERDGIIEAGYCIGHKFWGHGYMAEALHALIGFMFMEVGLNRIEAYHSTLNPASGRVMEKAGMIKEGFMKEKYFSRSGFHDCDCYGITKSDFLKQEELHE